MKRNRSPKEQRGGLKLFTRYRNIKPGDHLDSRIERSMNQLADQLTLESVQVTVEKMMTENPPIFVHIDIETPGPDIAVNARDYTSTAAFSKAYRELQKIAERKQNRSENRRQPSTRSSKPPRQRQLL